MPKDELEKVLSSKFFCPAKIAEEIEGNLKKLIMAIFRYSLEAMKIVFYKYNIWFHIDASWGGSVLLSKKHRDLMKGCDQSNSVTWCTHKAMAQPLMCTATLFKDPSILASLNNVEGTEYLFHNK